MTSETLPKIDFELNQLYILCVVSLPTYFHIRTRLDICTSTGCCLFPSLDWYACLCSIRSHRLVRQGATQCTPNRRRCRIGSRPGFPRNSRPRTLPLLILNRKAQGAKLQYTCTCTPAQLHSGTCRHFAREGPRFSINRQNQFPFVILRCRNSRKLPRVPHWVKNLKHSFGVKISFRERENVLNFSLKIPPQMSQDCP